MRDDLTPPHSDEAEQAVLGGLMLDNATLQDVAGVIQADDFYQPVHRAVWSTIVQLVEAGGVADVLTVMEAGGHELRYLNELVQSVPSATHAVRYAGIVRERSQRRGLMRLGADLADAALRGTDSGETAVGALVDKMISALMAMQGGLARWEPQPIDVLLPRVLQALEDRAGGLRDGIETGLVDLDRLLNGGMRPGELVVLGARPSMGKTALVLTIARNVARGAGVLLCSQEDSADMLVTRQVAAAGRVNLADLRMPDRAPDSMWTGVADGSDDLKGLHLMVDDQPALSLRDVRRKITQTKRRLKVPLRLVIVDYLQLMVGDAETRALELGRLAAGCKAMAKEFGVAFVLLSQLSRKADETNGPPRMDHLKESGGIEEAADTVALLWREARRNPTQANKHHAQLEVVKQKNGATDKVHLWFDGATQRFEAWEGKPPMRAGRD